MSVVAHNPASEPDRVRSPKVIRKCLLVMNASHVRISLLLFAEQAFFCRENRSRAVDVDRPTFENDALTKPFRTNVPCVGRLGHEASDLLVVAPVGVLSPAIKAEFNGESGFRRRFLVPTMLQEDASSSIKVPEEAFPEIVVVEEQRLFPLPYCWEIGLKG